MTARERIAAMRLERLHAAFLAAVAPLPHGERESVKRAVAERIRALGSDRDGESQMDVLLGLSVEAALDEKVRLTPDQRIELVAGFHQHLGGVPPTTTELPF